jgi:hypothetical protein
MRLLELGRHAGDAEALAAIVMQESPETSQRRRGTPKQPTSGQTGPGPARVFPIHSRLQPGTARRKPLNLEQLHQRIEALEQRIQARLLKQGDAAKKEDLEQLLRRMKSVVRQRALQLCSSVPTACWCWFKAFGREWWLDCQPLWWPRFAAAWQEALERARH